MAFQGVLLLPLQPVFFQFGKQVKNAVRIEAFYNKTRFTDFVCLGECFIPLLFDVIRQTFDIEIHG